jgi:hypothetical protein
VPSFLPPRGRNADLSFSGLPAPSRRIGTSFRQKPTQAGRSIRQTGRSMSQTGGPISRDDASGRGVKHPQGETEDRSGESARAYPARSRDLPRGGPETSNRHTGTSNRPIPVPRGTAIHRDGISLHGSDLSLRQAHRSRSKRKDRYATTTGACSGRNIDPSPRHGLRSGRDKLVRDDRSIFQDVSPRPLLGLSRGFVQPASGRSVGASCRWC